MKRYRKKQPVFVVEQCIKNNEGLVHTLNIFVKNVAEIAI